MLLFMTPAVFAQENTPLGYIVRQMEFKITDMYNLGRFDGGMGTARSAAMGGAFTSLGADLSSMSINPAGLGMYRGSEFGVTASLMLTAVENTLPGFPTAGSRTVTNGNRTSVGLNNVGVAFNILEGTGSLTSFTMGFGYNKLADYNHRSRVALNGSNNTILDMFAQSVMDFVGDVGTDGLTGNNPWRDPSDGGAWFHEWGAMLAYKTGLIERVGATDEYRVISELDHAGISQFANTTSRGSAGEYTFAGGWNFMNRFYLGFSLGVVNSLHVRDVSYEDRYTNTDRIRGMVYDQRLRMNTDGYNFKLGIVVRPVEELRIGLAVHSPTMMTVRTRYSSIMRTTNANGATIDFARSPDREFEERFITPTRLLAGASCIIANRAVLAVDYERTWYNGMRVFGSIYDMSAEDFYREDVRQNFRAANTVRAGLEVMAVEGIMLRGGASYVREGLRDEFFRNADKPGALMFDMPAERTTLTVSAGLGYRVSRSSSFDLTYVFAKTDFTVYDLYRYYDGFTDSTFAVGHFDRLRQRHNIMLAYNYRF